MVTLPLALKYNLKYAVSYVWPHQKLALISMLWTKALANYQMNSKLVWDCHQSLEELAEHNRVQLVWVPNHKGIEGNETANELERMRSERSLIGPEPVCIISVEAARDWKKGNNNNSGTS
jgi:ribonuclease HI